MIVIVTIWSKHDFSQNQNAPSDSFYKNQSLDQRSYRPNNISKRLLTIEDCTNGIDDDGDGLIDCLDPDCNQLSVASTDVPITIDSGSPNTVTSSIIISQNGVITDLDVLNLDISHTYVSDLSISLISPQGKTVIILDNPCSFQNDILIKFDDEASSSSWPCPPTDNLTYIPDNLLSAFDGEDIQGTWILEVEDVYSQDGGTINDWTLDFDLDCPCSSGFATVSSPASICQGASVELVAGGGSTYLWSEGNQTNDTITVSPTITTSYTVTVTDSAGCSEDISVLITVSPQPIITSITVQNYNCDSLANISYIFSDVIGFDTIEFSIDGGLTFSYFESDTSAFYLIDSLELGTYDLKTRWRNESCEYDIDVVSIEYTCSDSEYYCNLLDDSFIQCQGQSITGNVSLNDTIVSLDSTYIFTINNAPGSGDLNFNQDGTFSYSNDSVGVYTFTYDVTLTNIIDTIPDEICNKIQSLTTVYYGPSGVDLEVTAKNQVYSYGSFPNIQYGDVITIINDSGTYNGPHNTWEFYIDGGYHTEIHTSCSVPILGFTFGDFYVVEYQSTSGHINSILEEITCTGTATITISDLIVLVNATATTICLGDTTLLSASAINGDGPLTYLWSNGSINDTIIVAPIVSTDYLVTITDSQGCTNIDSTTIAVTDLTASIANNTGPITCSAPLATLTALPLGMSYVWSDGSSLATLVVSSPGTYYVTATDANGCSGEASSIVFEDISLPVAFAGLDATICLDDTITLSATGGASYVWSDSLGTTASIEVSPNATTTYIVTVTGDNGCTSIDSVVVNIQNPPNAEAGPDHSICPGSSINLTASGGLNYYWSENAGNTQSVNVYPTSTTTYFVTVEDALGCTDVDSLVVQIYPLGFADAGPDIQICIGNTTSLAASNGVAYLWSNGLGMDSSVEVSPSVSSTYYVTVTDVNGCEDKDSVTVIVNPLPTVTLNFTNDQACTNDSAITLSGGVPTGGFYTGPFVSNGTFDPSISGIGSHVISYTYTDLIGCLNIATDTMEVLDAPVVELNFATDIICISEAPLALSDGLPSGGSYTGVGINSSVFDPAVAGIGTHIISYQYQIGSNCIGTAQDTFEVVGLPELTLNLTPSDVCIELTSAVLEGGLPLGGSYSGIGVTNNIFDATISGLGTFSITYSVTDVNGCSNTISQDITVHDLPSVQLNLTQDKACISETILELSGGLPAGGVYSGVGVTSSTFNPNLAGVGSHLITYTFIDSYGCENFATDILEVEEVPNPSFELILDEACENISTINLEGGLPAGGIYSGPGVTNGIFDPSSQGPGDYIIDYTVTISSCAVTVSDTFTVYALPDVQLVLPSDTDCFGNTGFALSGGTPANGSWSGTGVIGSNFNSTLAGIGSHIITYSFTNIHGCFDSATDTLIVYEPPSVTLTLSDKEACEDETALLLDGISPTGGTFSGTGVTGNIFNPSAAGVGTHLITYTLTDINGCTNIATQNVQVFSIPQVTLELNQDQICDSDQNIILDGGLPIGGSYSGTGVTGNIFNPTVADVGQHQITYSYSINGCTAQTVDTIEVFLNPNVILNLDPQEICYGETDVALTGGLPTGGIYSGTGVSGNSFNSLMAGVGSHTLVYSYTDSNGCSGLATDVIIVNDLPSASLSLPESEVCLNESSIPLSGGFPVGGVYSGPGVSGSIFDASIAGPGVHVITYTYTDENGCIAEAIDNIEVFPLPSVTYSYEPEYCNQFDGTVTFTFIDQAYIDDIEFSLNGGVTWKPAIADNTVSITYGSLNNGNYTLLVRNVNGTCELNLGTITIGAVAGPTADAGNDVTINAGDSTTLNGSGGTFYDWTPALTLNNTSIYNPVATPSETTTYTLEVTDLNGCTDIDEVTVTVILPCLGIITDYPYYESFESGWGIWKQNTSADDIDWTHHSGATPSNGTGPNGASDGSFYIYVESSSPNYPSKNAIIESPCFDLRDHSCAQFTFDYNMYGAAMGGLELEITTDNGLTWTSLWTASGDQGNSWNLQSVDLFGYLENVVQLRFITTTGSNYTSDVAIDNLEFITSGCGCDDTTSPFLQFSLQSDPFPFSIDLDDDGDADMIVGTDGSLFYFQNNGDGTYTDITDTAQDPLPNLTWLDMTLAFADLDNDGDYDMSIIGNEPWNHNFYWNTGTVSSAVFTLAGTSGTPSSPIVGFNYAGLDGGQAIGYADCTIFFVDLDNDDDFDACMGGKLGWFHYYENTGDEFSPNFVQQTGSANPLDGFRALGENEGNGMQYESSPFFVDWDGDGDYDMFSGNQIATIQFFENIGTPENAVFVERIGIDNPFDDILFTEDTHISIIDEDCDGDWDVFYGDGDNNLDADLIMCDLLVATPNQAIANADATAYCIGETVFFTDSGTTGVEWNWSGPNGFSSSSQDPTILSVDLIDAGTYVVTVTNAQGCESIDSVTITVGFATADAGSDQTLELGNTTQLDGTGQGVYYNWTPSDGLSASDIPNPNANPTQTTTYTLTVTDANGCSATDQMTIFVISIECEESTTLFNADFENTTGDNYWIIGSGANRGNFIIGVPNPYIQSSITIMELTAHSGNQDLLTGTANRDDLDGGPTSARSPNITLSNTYISSEISFYYYFAHYTNSSSSDYVNIFIRDASNDQNLVTLVNETGASSDRDAAWSHITADLSSHLGNTVYIYVEAADISNGSKVEVALDDVIVTAEYLTQVNLTFSPDQVCETDDVFTLTGGTPVGGVYAGTGVIGSTFDPSLAGEGSHTITYTFTSNDGCVATSSDDIVVLDPPLVNLELALDEACENETILGLFGGIPTGGVYSGIAVTGNNFNPSLAGPGTHLITYTATDNNGCSSSATDQIIVYASSEILDVISTDAKCGVNDGTITIQFSDVVGISSIQFSLDGGTTWENSVLDNTSSVTYTGLAPGDYDLWVQDIDGYCVLDIEDASINEVSGPLVDLGPNIIICSGETDNIVPVIQKGTTPYSYQWSGPQGFQNSEMSIDVSIPGTYVITVTDANNCAATDAIVVSSYSILAESSSLEISCFGQSDGQIILSASGGNTPYTFDLGGGNLNSNGIFNNLSAGYYVATVTDNVGCLEILPISLPGPAQLSCFQDSCVRSTLTTWAGAAMGPWSGTGADFTASVSITSDASSQINGSVTTEQLSSNPWFVESMSGAPALELDLSWDSTPEMQGEEATFDSGTLTMTIVFSVPVDCPTIHLDNLGETIGGLNTASTLWTLTSAGSLNKLSGTSDLIVDNNQFYKIPNVLATATEPFATTCAFDGTAAGSIQLMHSVPITTISFTISGIGAELNGADVFKMAFTGTRCYGIDIDDYNCDDNKGKASVYACGGIPPYSFLWEDGNILATHENLLPGSHTVTITDSKGCTTTCSVTINDQELEIDVGSDLILCDTVIGNFISTVTMGQPPYTYLWTGPVGFSSSLVSPDISVSGQYILEIIDANNCSALDTVNAYFFPCDQTTPCYFLDEFNSFSYAGSDGTEDWSAYNWTERFDNNSSVSGSIQISNNVLQLSNPTSSFPSIRRRVDLSGKSSAILSFDFYDSDSLEVGDIMKVEVFDGSNWNTVFTYEGDLNGVLTPWIDISNYISTMTEIRFSFESGYNGTGEFLYIDNVRIDVDCTCLDFTDAGPDLIICEADSITLSGTSLANSPSFLWSPSDYLSDATIANPIAFPAQTTSYTLVVTDINGCEDTDQITVTVNPLPIVSISDDGPITCSVPSVSITAQPSGAFYQWNTGSTTQMINVNSPGYYLVTVTLPTGCQDTIGTTILEDIIPPTVDLGPDQEICEGSSITISASGGGTYLWNDLDNSSSASITVSPSVNTTYAVTVTTSNGCTAMDNILVVVNENPDVTLNLADSLLCLGASNYPLTGGLPSGGTYSGTAVSGNQFNASNAGVGVYQISYSFVDSDGCEGIAIDSIAVMDDLFENVSQGNQVECNGSCDGQINVDVNTTLVGDFNLQYTYDGSVYSLGPYTQDSIIVIQDLCAGSYSDITVIGLNGYCTEIWPTSIVIEASNAEWEHVTHTSDVSNCTGVCDGSFTVDANLGVTGEFNISYTFDGQVFTLGPYNFAGDILIDDLCAGDYTDITITAVSSGCSSVWPTDITIEEPEPQASIIEVINDLCQLSEGEITISVSEGTGPYTISWASLDGSETGSQTLNYQGNTTIDGLTGGQTYCITVTDTNGCTNN